MKITKIVITGGPCAGKSTGMSWIQKAFTQMGYTVLFVPETATELIIGGIAPWTCPTVPDFQKLQCKLQMEKEKTFENAAKIMPTDNVLIVCDRGVLDSKAFISKEEFDDVLAYFGSSEVEFRDNYARTETPEQAIAVDNKLIAAWTGHPHLRVIDNSSDFETKMKKLISEIASFLGEPEPLEIERKFLIEYPDISWLESLPNCEKVEIIQTYLNSNPNEEVRVRQRGANGNYIYFKTTKRKIDDIKRVEIEKRISKDEYLELLMNADMTKRPIRKTRYCLTYNNQYFEIDIYPFWKDKAILEIELSNENDPIDFPENIGVVVDVTDDDNYKNFNLATI